MASVEQIAEYKQEFQQAGFPVETTTLYGKTYPYYVIPPDWKKLPPALPKLFAFQMVPALEIIESQPTPECTLFAVSGAIQQDYRPLVALHEIHEYVENILLVAYSCRIVKNPIPDRPQHACHTASMAEFVELQQRPAEFRFGYIAMRAQFFKDLIPYAKEANYAPLLIEQFQESADFWAHLQETRGEIIAHRL